MFNVCVCVSVVSVSIDEEGSHSSSSEEEADTSSPPATPSSPSSSSSHPSTSASTPLDMPCPHPSSSSLYLSSSSPSSPDLSSSCPPGGLELGSPCSSHDPDSACGSGHASPLLGPRSQCSGASSPDCDQERGVCSSHQCVLTRDVMLHPICLFLYWSIKEIVQHLVLKYAFSF